MAAVTRAFHNPWWQGFSQMQNPELLCSPLSVTMPTTASLAASFIGWSMVIFAGSKTRSDPTLPLVICTWCSFDQVLYPSPPPCRRSLLGQPTLRTASMTLSSFEHHSQAPASFCTDRALAGTELSSVCIGDKNESPTQWRHMCITQVIITFACKTWWILVCPHPCLGTSSKEPSGTALLMGLAATCAQQQACLEPSAAQLDVRHRAGEALPLGRTAEDRAWVQQLCGSRSAGVKYMGQPSAALRQAA